MSIFCHPDIGRWKGVSDLLGVKIESVEFGNPGKVLRSGQEDATEIDMSVGDVLCEAKLTEDGFTSKDKDDVERYDDFDVAFHTDALRIENGKYANYQVIRNLLASIQHNKRHLLLCDERRSDLCRSYFETVSCLKSVHDRSRCGVVFWQEIARASGASLKGWLESKYGIA
jgi:hypothetical protein